MTGGRGRGKEGKEGDVEEVGVRGGMEEGQVHCSVWWPMPTIHS